MSSRALIFGLVALVAAGATAFMVRNWMSANRTQVQVQAAPVKADPEVLVSAQKLTAGMVIKAEHLKWQAWPESGITDAVLVRGKGDIATYIGSVVRNGIGPGEPMTDLRVVRPGERGFLAAILPAGMRAVAVPINATSGLSGLIFPGDRVDVILTHTIASEQKEGDRVRRASETVLENIRVLATDTRTDRESNDPALAKTATLEVSQKQAEIIAMVTELGKLSLSLRSLLPAASDQAVADAEAKPAEGVSEARWAAVLEAKRKGVKHEQSYTLDNQVSSLLDKSSKNGVKQTEITVMRGKEASQVTF